MDAFFGWYDILEGRKFQLAETKLNGITRMWWEKHKENHFRGGYGVLRTWEDMKLAMKRRCQPPDYKQQVHL